ncbi:hypothetical protein MYX07_05560 [Patescibacteria group bacterium AH-259-L07]|nr:hypothetical protein [Patescibacteria group bacterium AH-259-L07]
MSKKIFFITTNKGKYFSAKRVLKKYGITVIQKEINIPEPRGNIEEIAIQKAKYAYKIVRKPLIVMDAGFFIDSLNGFPMMFTNFVLETIGIQGILKLAQRKNRSCEFREILCYCDGLRKKPRLFKRVVEGKLSRKPKGKVKSYHWSKLAYIFVPKGEIKTMAEMTEKEFTNFRRKVDAGSHWEQFSKFYSQKS